jgi:hypothetical protein
MNPKDPFPPRWDRVDTAMILIAIAGVALIFCVNFF